MNENFEGSIENNGRSAAYNGFDYKVCPFRSGRKRNIWLTGYFDVKRGD
jgi:ribosome modulation factor